MSDKEVGAAVGIDIGDCQPESEDVVGQADFRIDVLEFQIAEVLEKHAPRILDELVLDNKQVQQPIRVIIKHADVARGSQGGRTCAALSADIDKLAVVVAKQLGIGQLRFPLWTRVPLCFAFTVVGRIEFQIAIVVQVGEHRAAGAGVELHIWLPPRLKPPVADVLQ